LRGALDRLDTICDYFCMLSYQAPPDSDVQALLSALRTDGYAATTRGSGSEPVIEISSWHSEDDRDREHIRFVLRSTLARVTPVASVPPVRFSDEIAAELTAGV
jgi:hypothetical protein